MKTNDITEKILKEFDKEFEESFSGGDMWNWERAQPIRDFIQKVTGHAVAEERDRVIEEIEGILNPLWKGTLNYASRYRNKNINSDREDLEEIESVITKLVLYLTKHYHEKNNKDRR